MRSLFIIYFLILLVFMLAYQTILFARSLLLLYTCNFTCPLPERASSEASFSIDLLVFTSCVHHIAVSCLRTLSRLSFLTGYFPSGPFLHASFGLFFSSHMILPKERFLRHCFYLYPELDIHSPSTILLSAKHSLCIYQIAR